MNFGAPRQRKRPPILETFNIQTMADQTSVTGSLFEPKRSAGVNGMNYDKSSDELRVEPFSFACELAHGSNRVRVSGFANIPELYQRIAERFSIPVSQILFCTLDTPQIDMNKLLSNQLSFHHVIYAHTRGQTKEVRFVKSAEALGLTVSDNKAGGVFVKRISTSGVLAKVLEKQNNVICPGDLIECINGRSFINSRHMDVVKYLKELPLKNEIVLRLISPEKNLMPGISKRQKSSGGVTRNQTIRFTATGTEISEALNKDQQRVLQRLADIVDDFIGIADEELAQAIFDIQCKCSTQEEFAEALQKNFSDFDFSTRFVEKFWTAYEYYLDALRDLNRW